MTTSSEAACDARSRLRREKPVSRHEQLPSPSVLALSRILLQIQYRHACQNFTLPVPITPSTSTGRLYKVDSQLTSVAYDSTFSNNERTIDSVLRICAWTITESIWAVQTSIQGPSRWLRYKDLSRADALLWESVKSLEASPESSCKSYAAAV